ncbi:MAG: GNAT family N-acetyltransferase [Nitrososphaeria archaeon]
MNQKSYNIRELKASDILALHKMYDSLSEETKYFFHPGFIGFESINFWWLLVQMVLFVSTIKMLKRLLLYIFPYLVFLSKVVVDERDKIVGFAFLKIKNRLPSKTLRAELGIVITDLFQGQGLGSKLMNELLKMAQKVGVKEIFLSVLLNNLRAIRLYEKYGFKYVCQATDFWRGNRSKAIIMKLNL